ncbi:MAG: tetratricopeptide repeat protein [Chloroflexi bacterium]|nr:tetratricopeptide repeat protein [Chloroflexota bacterium]
MNVSCNLPVQLTGFIGREKEIAEIKRLLDLPGSGNREGLHSARLITITGAGGAGKTRLAIQVAQDLRGLQDLEGLRFPDGVWFVDLAPLANPDLVSQTVATVFGLQEQGNRAITDLLRDYLRAKNLLIVLDNCEHLIDACAQFADDVLCHAPQVTILATSREALSIVGEITFRAPSLAIPDLKNLPSLESIAQSDAVQLFVARACAAQSSFALTEQNARIIAQICHRLDGMPLALELAAARVKVMGVEDIAARLDDRFRLLTNAGRKVVPRQQTLRATLDWSYDLLSDQERVLLRRLSVFAGGWTLDAAEAICANGHLDSHAILDVQSQLIDKSLAVVDEPSGHARYRFLETVRQYAREKLGEADEEKLFRSRHLDYFLKFAEGAEPKLRGTEQFIWLDRLEREHDNLRAAFESAHALAATNVALRLSIALGWFWQKRSRLAEGMLWLERARTLINANEYPFESARTLAFVGAIAWLRGDYAMAQDALDSSIAILRASNQAGKSDLAFALAYRSVTAMRQGDFRNALILAEESVAIFHDHRDVWGAAFSFYCLGRIALEHGDRAAARAATEESCGRFRQAQDDWGLALALSTLGLIALGAGDYTGARAIYSESLALRRGMNDAWGVAKSLSSLAGVERLTNHQARARELIEESLQLYRQMGSPGDVARALHNLGYLETQRGDYPRARELFIESQQLFSSINHPRGIAECLNGFAVLASATRQPKLAAQLLAAADAIFDRLGAQRWQTDQVEYASALNAARLQLTPAAFNAAWNAGRALTLEQAIAEALQVSAQPATEESHITAEPPQYPAGLTQREVEVLRLLAMGLSNQEIADKLVLSKRTVHAHLRSIFSKLDVTTRTAATRVAIEHKIV